jgi:hypothetical protein
VISGSATDDEKHDWHLKGDDCGRLGEELIRVGALDPNEAFSQDHFISSVSSDPKKHAQNLPRRKHPIELAVHMDDSSCHDGQKIVDKMRRNHMLHLHHPPY